MNHLIVAVSGGVAEVVPRDHEVYCEIVDIDNLKVGDWDAWSNLSNEALRWLQEEYPEIIKFYHENPNDPNENP